MGQEVSGAGKCLEMWINPAFGKALRVLCLVAQGLVDASVIKVKAFLQLCLSGSWVAI